MMNLPSTYVSAFSRRRYRSCFICNLHLASWALKSNKTKAASLLQCYSIAFTLFKTVTAQIVDRTTCLVLWFENVCKRASLKTMKLVACLFTRRFICFSRSSFKLTYSFNQLHLFKLSVHQLLLEFHQTLGQIENSTPHRLLSSKGQQALGDVLRRLSTSYTRRKPFQHDYVPLLVYGLKKSSSQGVTI